MTRNLALLVIVAGAVALAGPLCAQEMEWVNGKWVVAAPPVRGTPAGELALIRQYADRHQSSAVISTAERFLKDYPGQAGSEEVMLLAGEAEIQRGHYWQAYGWFEKQLDAYGAGEFSQRALQREFDVAEAFLAGKKRIVWGFIYLPAKDEGLDILIKIVDRAPGSNLAEKAMMRVADYHFAQREYADAAEAYDRYQQLFKTSPRMPYVMHRAALATLGTFLSTDNDEVPLIDAEQRFLIFKSRYPKEAQAAEVDNILTLIHNLRGEKLCEIGVYYQKVKRPQAAAFYFNLVTEDFGDTQWGGLAKTQLQMLGDVKPVAPQGRPVAPPRRRPAAATQPAVGPVTTQPTTSAASQPTTAKAPEPETEWIEDLVPHKAVTTRPATRPATRPTPKPHPLPKTLPATAPIKLPTTGPVSWETVHQAATKAVEEAMTQAAKNDPTTAPASQKAKQK